MALTRPKYSQIYDSDFKNSCRVATGSHVTLAGGAPSTVDGKTLVVGNRILVRAQSPATQNGIYYVSVVGTGSNGTWVRTLDALDGSRLTSGTTLSIEEGSTYGGKLYRMTTPDPVTINVSDILWTDVSGGAVAGGSNGQFQYNYNNAFTAAANLNYIYANGAVIANSGITSTSTTSGAIQVEGGIGISGNVNVGGNIAMTANAYSTLTIPVGNTNQRPGSASLGMIRYNTTISSFEGFGAGAAWSSLGGVKSVDGYAYISAEASAGAGDDVLRFYSGSTGSSTQVMWASGSNISILPTTGATSTTTGALQVAGGASISGNLWVGGNIYVANLISTSTTTLTLQDPMVYLTATGNLGTYNYDIGLYSDYTAPGYRHTGIVRDYTSNVWAFFSNLASEPAATINWSDAGIAYDTVKAGSLVLANSTASTSTTSGALQVAGGAGIQGAVYAGSISTSTISASGAVNITNSTTSTSTTTGALIVTGGVGVSGNLNVASVTKHGNNTFTKATAAASAGEVIFDNGTTDTPGVSFYYANNQNFGIDVASSSLRFVSNINESNGAVVGSFNNLGVFTVGIQNQTVAIANGGTSGTGNIGAVGATFNTVFAKATTAQYADLAENYVSDKSYEPGTVVIFGGTHEITITTKTHDTRVAGVISTNPAYLMNSEALGLPVAFTGRVPCKVQGPVAKGEVLVTSAWPGVATKLTDSLYKPGCVLGKSLEEITTADIVTIEVVVGRF
jgi:hypothetical protein